MPDLRELPDRKGRMKVGVTSDKLIGKTLDWFGKTFQIVEKGKSNWKSNPAVVTIKASLRERPYVRRSVS